MNQRLLTFLLFLNGFLLTAQTPCAGGFAGSYPCNGIILQAYIPTSTFGAAEAQDSWGWTDPQDGKEYAIVTLNNATAFVDISNPTSPVYLGKLPSHTGGTSLWRDVKTYNNHAFIVSEVSGEGMQVFDLTRLRGLTGSPVVTFTEDAHYAFGNGKAHNIVINEDTGYAYLVGTRRSTNPNGGPIFINIQTPTNPTYAGEYDDNDYYHDAQVVIYSGPDTDYTGREILIGSAENEIVILDVTNKSNPIEIAKISYPDNDYTHQGWFTEDQRFFIAGDEEDEIMTGENTKTMVFDFNDLDNPSLYYTFTGATTAIDHNGYVKGNRLYLANYSAGMRILKISGLYDTTPSMTEVNYFDTFPSNNSAGFNATWNVYPFFESGNLVVTGFGDENINGDGGLFILKDPNYDNVDPVGVCQNITISLNSSGIATITAIQIDGGSTDNFGIVSRSIDIDTFTCDDLGANNVTLTVEDDYGNTSSCIAIVTVEGEITEYSSGSWSNGAPTVGSHAKFNDDYNTSSGNIDACSCEILATKTVTVSAGDYLNITKYITVNGSLIVEHQGNVVQEDKDALVTNNGTINVELTTPVLQTRDFMILGSPMTTETRNGVFNNAFLVLYHTPANFIPHPAVPPGGTNFADDNGDFWNQLTGSNPINPGEGYIVRPQSSYTDPANTTYSMTYSQGTLNNGDVSRTVVYNGAGP
ncbi:MAG: choice-of-anchor B family protein, partial [Bacteroidetes bacterium]|nr:choice-of-anchor B family protein [Bacteroidota bacterium]